MDDPTPDRAPGSPEPDDPAAVWSLVRPYMTGPRPDGDPPRPALELTTLVQSTVAWAEVELELKTYTDVVGGELVRRQRAFGLEAEHLAVLRLCQEPRAVAEIAAALGRAGREPDEELAFASADVNGPPDLPVGYVRALLDDLFDKGLVEQFDDPDLANRDLYEDLLRHLHAGGSVSPASPASRTRRPGAAGRGTPSPRSGSW